MFIPALSPNPTLAERFHWLVDCIFHSTSTENGRRHTMDWPLAEAMGGWARRLRKRFAALYAQWKAGTLPAARGCERSARAADRPRLPGLPAASLLPRAFAWLHRLFPESAPWCAGTYESMLCNEPEMREFVAAAPQAGGILRPFCRMLGVRPPEWLALPKRVRERTEKDPLPPHPAAARFPDTPPARAAARALARMAAGQKVDVTRLSAVAYGYFVHPPRDGTCPPPEIGYSRGRALPRDYEGRFKNWD